MLTIWKEDKWGVQTSWGEISSQLTNRSNAIIYSGAIKTQNGPRLLWSRRSIWCEITALGEDTWGKLSRLEISISFHHTSNDYNFFLITFCRTRFNQVWSFYFVMKRNDVWYWMAGWFCPFPHPSLFLFRSNKTGHLWLPINPRGSVRHKGREGSIVVFIYSIWTGGRGKGRTHTHTHTFVLQHNTNIGLPLRERPLLEQYKHLTTCMLLFYSVFIAFIYSTMKIDLQTTWDLFSMYLKNICFCLNLQIYHTDTANNHFHYRYICRPFYEWMN